MITLHEIQLAFHDAAVAAYQGGATTTALADRFFDAIVTVPVRSATGQRWAAQAFETIVAKIELLPNRGTLDIIVVAADALAACILASPKHADIMRLWVKREHPAARTAALRACSKLCEYQTSLVDGDLLCWLARQLDGPEAQGKADETVMGYLSQVAGRLRGEDKGLRLIEQLAFQGPSSRAAAAHAISYSVEMDRPFSPLSVFARMGESHAVSAPPSRRLLQLLSALLNDPDPSVAAAAECSASILPYAWPELADLAANLLLNLKALPNSQQLHATSQPSALDFARSALGRISLRHGRLLWSPELLEQEVRAEAAGEKLPPIHGAPRLFISYRWGDVIGDDDLLAEELAGLLHGLGYTIVYDRDPLNLHKSQSAADVLNLLHNCTHFIPVATEGLYEHLGQRRTEPKSALDLEWKLAQRLARQSGLQWLSVWLSGSRLPRALAKRPFVDARDDNRAIMAAFPKCQFQVISLDDRGNVLSRSACITRAELRAELARAGARRRVARVQIEDVTQRS